MRVTPAHLQWTKREYDAALARVNELVGCAPGSPESVELDALVEDIRKYEERAERWRALREDSGVSIPGRSKGA